MNEFDIYKECVTRLLNLKADYVEFHRPEEYRKKDPLLGIHHYELWLYLKTIIAETESKLDQIGKLSEIKREQK